MICSSRFGALLLAVVICCASAVTAGDVPTLLSHQGRLLDATDQPITGTYTITYSIFESPTGGAPLWTETQSNVQVTDGLFASNLGSVVPISPDVLSDGSGGGGGGSVGRYLEIQVGGVTLTPRMRLAASPYAMASSRVSGDIQTQAGRVKVSNADGTRGVVTSATTSSASIAIDEGGVHRLSISSDGPGGGGGGSSSIAIDEPGVHLAIAGTGTGAGSPPAGVIILEADVDGDGEYEPLCGMAVSSTEASSSTGWDTDGDGVPDNTCASTVSPTKSQLAIKTKGTSAQRQSATMSTDAAGAATFECEIDNDFDGIAENFVESSSTPEGSSVRVVSLNGLPPGEPVLDNIALTANGTSSTVSLAKGVAKVGLGVAGGIGIPGGSVLSSRYLTNSGLDSTATLQSSTATTAGFRAINTKGTGATVRAGMGSTESASSVILEADLDGDGEFENACSSSSSGTSSSISTSSRFGSGPRQTTSMDGSFSHATMRCSADNDDDGVAENFLEGKASSSGSSLRVISLNGLPPGVPYDDNIKLNADGTASSITIDEPGTGHSKIQFQVDATGPTISMDEPTSGNAITWQVDTQAPTVSIESPSTSSSITWEVDATGPSLKLLDNGGIVIALDGAGNGYFSSNVGVGVTSPTHHIDVTGGAYCDGTNWVNASDRNSKENFVDVNGEELLNKLSELEITEWNYKGNEADKHIGPTAQDFQKTFGVGSDGKSISTIDPSGIALAAIKELNKQNNELKDQNKELKKELDELKRLVNKIASKK